MSSFTVLSDTSFVPAPKGNHISRVTGDIIPINFEQFKMLTSKIQLIILTAKGTETERLKECFQPICHWSIYRLGFFGSYFALHCQTGQGGHEASSITTQLFHDLGHVNQSCYVLMIGMAYGLCRSSEDQTQVTGRDVEAFLRVMEEKHPEWRCEEKNVMEWRDTIATAGPPDMLQRLPLCFTPEASLARSREMQQRIGDVLFADRIYAVDRDNQGKLKPLGTPRPVNPILVQTARTVQQNWEGSRKWRLAYPTSTELNEASVPWPVRAHVGLMLAGDSIVGDMNYREKLRQENPEAVGGEMEGAGLQTAVDIYNNNLFHGNANFLMIKGIMDWGVAKNDKMQKQAIDNSIRFSFDVLEALKQQKIINDAIAKGVSCLRKRQEIFNVLLDVDTSLADVRESQLAYFAGTRVKIESQKKREMDSPDDFVGREWLDAWVREQENQQCNYIVLEAPPGTGKSEFLRHWVMKKLTDVKFTAQNYLVYHTIIPNTDTATSVVQTVTEAIEKQFDFKRTKSNRATQSGPENFGTFKDILEAASQKLKGGAKLYIYIDSLDSIRGSLSEAVDNLQPILRNLPVGVIVVLTCRPRQEGWLTNSVMAIDSRKIDNNVDIALYIQRKAKQFSLRIGRTEIQQLVDKCDGCFAYAKHLLARPDVREVIANPKLLPEGLPEYTKTLWHELVPRFNNAHIPLPIAAGLLGLVALNHTTLTKKELTRIVKEAGKEYQNIPCFGLTSGKAYKITQCIKYVDPFLQNAQSFFAITRDKNKGKTEQYRMFHNAFRDYVVDEVLDEDEGDFCRIFLANFRSDEVRRFVYDEFSTPYELENADFIDALTNFFISLANVRDIPRKRMELPNFSSLRYVMPVCWYLYGHFWWDEYDPSFPLCTKILESMQESKARYDDARGRASRTIDIVLKELQWFRSHWPRVSVWRARRASCSDQLEATKAHWKEAQAHLNTLCEKLALEVPQNKLDEKLTSADEFKAASAIATNFRAECAYGQGDLALARDLFRQALPQHEKVQFLDWCVPYSRGELAEVLLDSGQVQEAIEQIQISIKIWDENIGTDDEDNLGLAEAYRFCGDCFWKIGNVEMALESDVLSFYYMFLGHSDADTFSDAYCQAFHRETAWSAMDRLSELYDSGETNAAIAGAVRLHDFWHDYWEAINKNTPVSMQTYTAILSDVPREASIDVKNVYEIVDTLCADVLYPRVPNLNEDYYEDIVDGIKKNVSMKMQVANIKQYIASAIEKVMASE